MELTIETSCCKYPERYKLLDEWDYNIKSLIKFVEQAHIGIKGQVTRDSRNGPPATNAKIFVRRIDNENDYEYR